MRCPPRLGQLDILVWSFDELERNDANSNFIKFANSFIAPILVLISGFAKILICPTAFLMMEQEYTLGKVNATKWSQMSRRHHLRREDNENSIIFFSH